MDHHFFAVVIRKSHALTHAAMQQLRAMFLVLVLAVAATIVIFMLWTSVLSYDKDWLLKGRVFYGVKGMASERMESHRTFHREKQTPLNRVKRQGEGYILTLDYTGQQSAGIRGILTQQCWTAAFDLPLRIVEPYCNNSRLVNHFWKQNDDGQTLKFRDFFNLEHFNNQSAKVGNPTLVSWEEFVQHAPRRIIAVTIAGIHQNYCLKYNVKLCSGDTGDVDKTTVTKFVSGCPRPQTASQALSFLQELGFEVVRNVCLNCSSGMPSRSHFPPEKVTKLIFGEFSPTEVSVLFDQWKFVVQMTPHCEPHAKCPEMPTALSERIKLSPKVQQQASAYIDRMSYRRGSPTVAVMIRLEWYIVMNQHLNQEVHECLRQIEPVLKGLKEEIPQLQIDKPLLAMDIGRFGSSTWPQTLAKRNISEKEYSGFVNDIRTFVRNMTKLRKWDFEAWEKGFTMVTGGIEDRGYIASLQGAIASKANCLLLMGGGSFQRQALKYYLESHPEKQCVRYVCLPPNWLRDFSSIYDGLPPT